MPKKCHPIVGVLDLQGDVIEHRRALEACGATVVSVKTVEDLKKVEALVMPGGESTTIGRLLKWTGLDEAICARAQKNMPIYGTCAGAILLANLGLMDIEVERNAYGRQMDSFEAEVEVNAHANLQVQFLRGHTKPTGFLEKSSAATLGGIRIPAVFIRAPRLHRPGKNVQVLAECRGDVVLARQGNLLVSTFHPELTSDLTLHRYFLTFLDHEK